ncbi:g protein-coupled receptor-related [Anaeramoeba flamelloides]|uniref:G protein-coupled receptor-related n=1 Tax=Anaeramoeba flamelloides TaxID=1746091 RepID=A0AAV8A2M9_9EUKA|nr:g protein-coupled receptor-related [Anaeramoeba flamelloides]
MEQKIQLPTLALVITILFLQCSCKTHTISSGYSLTKVISNSSPGDIIRLKPGFFFTEQIDFNSIFDSGELTIQGSRDGHGEYSKIVLVCEGAVCQEDKALFVLSDDLNLVLEKLEFRSVNKTFQTNGKTNTSLTFDTAIFKYGISDSNHFLSFTDELKEVTIRNSIFEDITVIGKDYGIINCNNTNIYIKNTTIQSPHISSSSYNFVVDINPESQPYNEETMKYERITIESCTFGSFYFKIGKILIKDKLEINEESIWEECDVKGEQLNEGNTFSDLIMNGNLKLVDHSKDEKYTYDIHMRKLSEINLILESNNLISWQGCESLTLGFNGKIYLAKGSQMNINTEEFFVNSDHYVASLYGIENGGIVIQDGAVLSFFNNQNTFLSDDSSSVWAFLLNSPILCEKNGNIHFENGFFTINGPIQTNKIEDTCYIGRIENYGNFYFRFNTTKIEYIAGDESICDEQSYFQNYGLFTSMKENEIPSEQHDFKINVPFYNYDNESKVVIESKRNVTFEKFVQDYYRYSNDDEDSGDNEYSEYKYTKHPHLLIKKGAIFSANLDHQEFKQGTIRGAGIIEGGLVSKGTLLWPGYDQSNKLVSEFLELVIKGEVNFDENAKIRFNVLNLTIYEKLKIESSHNDDQKIKLNCKLDIVFLYPYIPNLSDAIHVINLNGLKDEIENDGIQFDYNIANEAPIPDNRADPDMLLLTQRFWKTLVEPGTPGESDYNPYQTQADESNQDYYKKEIQIIRNDYKRHYQDYFQEFEIINQTTQGVVNGEEAYGLIIRSIGCPPGKIYEDTKIDCVDCSKGLYSDQYSSTVCIKCLAGTVSKRQGYHKCDDCLPGTYSGIGYGECLDCSITSYNPAYTQSECLNCPKNTRTAKPGSESVDDCLCKPSYYKKDGICLECPPGGVCDQFGIDIPLADDGFWNSSSTDVFFYTCIPREACVGVGQCGENYEGRMCGQCVPGTYRFGNHCKKCGNENTKWRGFAWFILLIFFCYFFYKFSVTGYPPLIYFTTITLAIYYFQEISLLSLFELKWPNSLIGLFNVFSTFNLNIDILASECHNENWTLVNKFIFAIFLPIICGSVYYCYYLCASIWSYLIEPRFERIKFKYPFLKHDYDIEKNVKMNNNKNKNSKKNDSDSDSDDDDDEESDKSKKSNKDESSSTDEIIKNEIINEKIIINQDNDDDDSDKSKKSNNDESSSTDEIVKNVNNGNNNNSNQDKFDENDDDKNQKKNKNNKKEKIVKNFRKIKNKFKKLIKYQKIKVYYFVLFRKLLNFRTMDELYLLGRNCFNAYSFMLSFIYLPICYWIMKPMGCTSYETGFTVFDPEPKYSCGGSRYGALLAFSIIFFLIYIIGIPLLTYYQFQTKKNKFIFREDFSLLIGRFSEEKYFWELVYMMRRFVFVVFALFISRYPMMQTTFSEMALFFTLLIQLYAKPMKEERHNKLEFLLLLTRVFIFLIGTLFYAGDIQNNHLLNFLVSLIYLIIFITIIIIIIVIKRDYKDNMTYLLEREFERKELERQISSASNIIPSSISKNSTQSVAGVKIWKLQEIAHFVNDDTIPASILNWILQAEKEQRERFADIISSVIKYSIDESTKLHINPIHSNNSISDSNSNSNSNSSEYSNSENKTDQDEKNKIANNTDIKDHILHCQDYWQDDLLPFVTDSISYWLNEASLLDKRTLSIIYRSLDLFIQENNPDTKTTLKQKLLKPLKIFKKMKKSNIRVKNDQTGSDNSSTSTSSGTSSDTPSSSSYAFSDNEKGEDLELKDLNQN